MADGGRAWVRVELHSLHRSLWLQTEEVHIEVRGSWQLAGGASGLGAG